MRKYRLEKGLKQIDLARYSRVDEMTIVNWELDRTKPVKTYTDRLKKHLGVKI